MTSVVVNGCRLKFSNSLFIQAVIASASEAIQSPANEEWIASSLTLLAMTL
jgi:hypothetical protein